MISFCWHDICWRLASFVCRPTWGTSLNFPFPRSYLGRGFLDPKNIDFWSPGFHLDRIWIELSSWPSYFYYYGVHWHSCRKWYGQPFWGSRCVVCALPVSTGGHSGHFSILYYFVCHTLIYWPPWAGNDTCSLEHSCFLKHSVSYFLPGFFHIFFMCVSFLIHA